MKVFILKWSLYICIEPSFCNTNLKQKVSASHSYAVKRLWTCILKMIFVIEIYVTSPATVRVQELTQRKALFQQLLHLAGWQMNNVSKKNSLSISVLRKKICAGNFSDMSNCPDGFIWNQNESDKHFSQKLSAYLVFSSVVRYHSQNRTALLA